MQERLKRLQGEVDALELRNLRLMEKLCRQQKKDLEKTRFHISLIPSTEKCDLGMRPQGFVLAFLRPLFQLLSPAMCGFILKSTVIG